MRLILGKLSIVFLYCFCVTSHAEGAHLKQRVGDALDPIREYFQHNSGVTQVLVRGSRRVPSISGYNPVHHIAGKTLRMHHFAAIISKDGKVLRHYSFSPKNTLQGDSKSSKLVLGIHNLDETHQKGLFAPSARDLVVEDATQLIASLDNSGIHHGALNMKLIPVADVTDSRAEEFHEFMINLRKEIRESNLAYQEQQVDCTAIHGCIDYFRFQKGITDSPPQDHKNSMFIGGIENLQKTRVSEQVWPLMTSLFGSSDLTYYAGPTQPLLLQPAMRNALITPPLRMTTPAR